jgi:hypothetical protein
LLKCCCVYIEQFLKIKRCEVFESDFETIGFVIDGKTISVTFKRSFLLSAWIHKQQLLRITADATGKCKIADIGNFDWESLDFESMNKNELLENGKLVDIYELNYSYIEADAESFL